MVLGALLSIAVHLSAANGTSAYDRLTADCLNGLKPVLLAGSFSGSVDCRRDHLETAQIGNIRTARHSFAIYDYHYRSRPVCAECATHGGQRILILRDGAYWGQFKPDTAQAMVRGRDLILIPHSGKHSRRKPTVIHFGNGGPSAKTLLFDGEAIRLFR